MRALSKAILLLNAIWAFSSAAPLMDPKDPWEQNVLVPLGTPECSSNGRCWGWLPVSDVQDDPIFVSKDLEGSRLQARRQIIDPNSESLLEESWKDNPVSGAEVKPSLPTARQVPSKVTKKDVVMSRGWSVGGMPFSVLYMNPHGSRGNHNNGSNTAAGTGQQENGKPAERPAQTFGHPNYRIAVRNGTSGQTRRQYSIIPQLFISYGWGTFGK